MSKIRTARAKFGDVVVIHQENHVLEHGYLGLVIGTLGNGLVVVQWGPDANDLRNFFDCEANLEVIDHIDEGITLGSVVVITSQFDLEDRTGWLGHIEYYRFYESGPRWGVRVSMETQGFIAEYSVGTDALEVIDYIPLEDEEYPVQEIKLPKCGPGDITGMPERKPYSSPVIIYRGYNIELSQDSFGPMLTLKCGTCGKGEVRRIDTIFPELIGGYQWQSS